MRTTAIQSTVASASGDAGRMTETVQPQQDWTRSSQELGNQFGVSPSALDRVRAILEQGTPEQIRSIREPMTISVLKVVPNITKGSQSFKFSAALRVQNDPELAPPI